MSLNVCIRGMSLEEFFCKKQRFCFSQNNLSWNVGRNPQGSLTPNSYVIYLDWIISVKVDRVCLYCDPGLSCFTLHEIAKNADGSKQEIQVGHFNTMPKGILKLGVDGMTQNQNQNEVAYFRNPTFSPCSWRHLSLHAKKNMKPVQRLKGDLDTVFDYQRDLLV